MRDSILGLSNEYCNIQAGKPPNASATSSTWWLETGGQTIFETGPDALEWHLEIDGKIQSLLKSHQLSTLDFLSDYLHQNHTKIRFWPESNYQAFIMAADALAEVAQLKKRMLAEDYGGSQTNQFVADMKASTLFQLNWGELLSAAPTALSLMGACWIAASSPSADQITMTKSVPAGGFKFIVSRSSPTLRSMLVDGKTRYS